MPGLRTDRAETLAEFLRVPLDLLWLAEDEEPQTDLEGHGARGAA